MSAKCLTNSSGTSLLTGQLHQMQIDRKQNARSYASTTFSAVADPQGFWCFKIMTDGPSSSRTAAQAASVSQIVKTRAYPEAAELPARGVVEPRHLIKRCGLLEIFLRNEDLVLLLPLPAKSLWEFTCSDSTTPERYSDNSTIVCGRCLKYLSKLLARSLVVAPSWDTHSSSRTRLIILPDGGARKTN